MRDLVVVEVLQLAEAHDLGVEPHPVVEPALFDVADDVIDASEADGRTDRRVGQVVVVVAGLEQLAAVTAAVDERVHRVAVRRDLAESQLAVLVVL